MWGIDVPADSFRGRGLVSRGKLGLNILTSDFLGEPSVLPPGALSFEERGALN